MKVIILAGGRATRLPNSAKDIPKILVEVGGKPILQHQLDLLKAHGLEDIRLALGFRARQIIDYLEGKYEHRIESEPLGTGGAIEFASNDLKDDFMVLNGDTLSDINLSQFINLHNYNKKKASREINSISVWETADARDFGLMKLEGTQVLRFQEKPSEKRAGFINSGFYILSPQVFSDIKEKNFSIETEVFPKLAERGKLCYFLHRGFWTDLGTEERLREASQHLTC